MPQLGVKLLVVVSLRTALPVPVKVTLAPTAFPTWLWLLITAGPLTTDQTPVPLVEVPDRVNAVVAAVTQLAVWLDPAAAVGFGLTITVAVAVHSVSTVPVGVVATVCEVFVKPAAGVTGKLLIVRVQPNCPVCVPAGTLEEGIGDGVGEAAVTVHTGKTPPTGGPSPLI